MPSQQTSYLSPTTPVNPWANIDFGAKGSLPSLPSTGTYFGQTPTATIPTVTPSGAVETGLAGSPGGGGGNGSTASNTAGLIGALAPLLIGLLGSNPAEGKATGATDATAAFAKIMGQQGQTVAGQGQDALAPVMKYLMGILSGNPVDTLQATQPDRARVLDQYDTARKAAVKEAPRGGGLVSGLASLETKQASDLSTLTSTARSTAAATLGPLGKGLIDTGIQEIGTATQAFNAASGAYNTQAQEKNNQMAGIGKAVGAALPFILMALA